MSSTQIFLKNLDEAAKVIPRDTPVAMLNLIKFKPVTTYPEGTFSTLSGEEAYTTRYVPAFIEFAKSVSNEYDPLFKPLFVGNPHINLVGAPHSGGENWDRVGLIWYPNFAAFRRWVDSPEYAANALPHRLAALEEYRLFALTQA